jgi:hypothetical protein
MHVTVLAGKSVQSFGKGNISLEGGKMTKSAGGGDVMCCPIGSEMWICMRYKRRENENQFKLCI